VTKQDGQPDGMSTPLGTGGNGAAAGNGAAPGIGSNTAPHLAYHDLRKWLDEAEKLGEVKHVKGLSWQKDIGMVSEMAAHTDNAPCFVFEDVRHDTGQPRAAQFLRRQAQEHDARLPDRHVQGRAERGLRTHYAADMKRIPPTYVESGPVMQNVITGDKIDITKFPAPQWHAKDGGRYIGTGCYTVIRDPDDGWINCGPTA
jgi:4-hydroxy-3-polyprenylbenzoate decarboxylase